MEKRTLWPNEDQSIFLWQLFRILDLAEPDLSEEARTILLTSQFMKSFPAYLRNRLLEKDPTPFLEKMRNFGDTMPFILAMKKEQIFLSLALFTINLGYQNKQLKNTRLYKDIFTNKVTSSLTSLVTNIF